MTKMDAFQSFLRDRLVVFADEVFQAVQEIMSEQRDEIKSTKEENRVLKRMLAEAKSASKRDSAEDAPAIHLEELAPEQQNLNLQDSEPSLMQVKMEIFSFEQSSKPQETDQPYPKTCDDAPAIHPEQRPPEQLNPSFISQDSNSSLVQLKVELCSEHQQTACSPSPKTLHDQRLSPLASVKSEESEGLRSYITIDLVPCDSEMPRTNTRGVTEKAAPSCPYVPFGEPTIQVLQSDFHRRKTSLYCQICDKHFKHRFSMRNHMIVHQRIRPFRCSFCGKGFKAKNHLREHERIHTGEKPFACSLCGKCFTQVNHVKVHFRNHHHGDCQVLEVQKKLTN